MCRHCALCSWTCFMEPVAWREGRHEIHDYTPKSVITMRYTVWREVRVALELGLSFVKFILSDSSVCWIYTICFSKSVLQGLMRMNINHRFWSWTLLVQILILHLDVLWPWASYLTCIPVLSFVNWNNTSHFRGLLQRTNELIYVKVCKTVPGTEECYRSVSHYYGISSIQIFNISCGIFKLFSPKFY